LTCTTTDSVKPVTWWRNG